MRSRLVLAVHCAVRLVDSCPVTKMAFVFFIPDGRLLTTLMVPRNHLAGIRLRSCGVFLLFYANIPFVPSYYVTTSNKVSTSVDIYRQSWRFIRSVRWSRSVSVKWAVSSQELAKESYSGSPSIYAYRLVTMWTRKQ